MKKAFWIFGIIALFLIGDRIGGYILESIVLKSKFRYSRLYRGEAKADILLVGNSRGLSFYQPYMEEMTEKTTFNVSYSAMPMTLAEVFVQDYFEKYGKPTQMLIDVTICDRENPQLIAGFNAYSAFSERVDSIVTATEPTVGYGGDFSHLFRYNGEIFQRSVFYLNKLDNNWLLDREIGQRLKDDLVNVIDPTVELVDEMVESLVRTVQFAERQGVKVDLVVSPYFKPFAQKIVNLDEMIAQVEKATGKKVYDYSRSMDDTSDFGDYQHINVKGSRTYIKLMQNDGIIPYGNKGIGYSN